MEQAVIKGTQQSFFCGSDSEETEMVELVSACWGVTNLSNFSSNQIYIQNGFPCGNWNDDGIGILQIRPFNISENGNISMSLQKYIEIDDKNITNYLLQQNDILFNNTNSEDLVGKTAMWAENFSAVLSNHMTIIRVLDNQIFDQKFLAYYFHYQWICGEFKKLCRRHVNQASVSTECLVSLNIPYPPLSEQKAIARILTTVQDAISSQEALIAKLKELKRSMMQHLFTRGTKGEKTKMTEIGEIPESWDLINIEKMGKIITGSTPSTKKAEYYNPKEIDFIAPADIGYGRYIYSSDKQISLAGFEVNRPISKDAVCCVCIGSSIGKVAKAYKDRSTTNQQINSIICDKTFISDFIYYTMVFYSDYWKKYATFGPVPILSKGMLGKIKLPVCLDVDEQIKIAKSLVAVDQKIESALEKVSSYHNLFKTLLHELMSGQTRIEG